MERNSQKFKQLVYDLMNGSLNLKDYPVEESRYVENEYEEGKFCEETYSKIFDLNRKLCERLGIGDGEDKDVEDMINYLFDIQRHMCMKMYEYGWLFAKIEEDKKNTSK